MNTQDVSIQEREKVKSVALEILRQFQNNGMTEKEVNLTIFWIDELAKEAIKQKHLNTYFSL